MRTVSWKKLVKHFVGLFFPHLCMACREALLLEHQLVCMKCQFELPKTTFHQRLDNLFTLRFAGRLPVHTAGSLYYFSKESPVRALVHALKYKGYWELGVGCGLLYGKQLRKSPNFDGIDLIVPVPLHPKKEWLRGYNQSACFAQGLSESMGVPYYKEALLRKRATETQTRKSRLERFENVADVFGVREAEVLKHKHVLLVDDVMTTGATLEACAEEVLKVPGTKVSFATIAFAT